MRMLPCTIDVYKRQALDCASSEMYEAGKGYYLNGRHLTSGELIAYAKGLTEKYHFVFIEDLLDENDWEGYEKAHREITRTCLLYTSRCV